MVHHFLNLPKNSDRKSTSRLLPARKSFALALTLFALSSLLIAACNDETVQRKPAVNSAAGAAKQYLIWDTTPAAKMVQGDITPFLAKAVLTKNLGLAPTCQPTYSLAKAGSADATINLGKRILTALQPGIVTLTASCAADATYQASSIAAKVEITQKAPSNLQLGIYMEPMLSTGRDSTPDAVANLLSVAEPSYSMYSYLSQVLKPGDSFRAIPDATFVILKDKTGNLVTSVDYTLKDELSTYLLTLSYNETNPVSRKYLAIRITKPVIGDVAGKNYEIKNADDLLKIRWNLKGNYNITKSFIMPDLNDTNYLAIPNYKTVGWSPIASEATPFQGTLDGHNFSIARTTIPNNNRDMASLFGALKSATVKNLKLDEAFIYGGNYVGLLAGKAEDVNLENIRAQLRIPNATASSGIWGKSYLGGLVGMLTNTDPNKVLKELHFDGDLAGLQNLSTSDGKFVGGVIGKLTGNLASASYGGIIVAYEQVGGIVGELNGKLSSALTLADVEIYGSTKVGGLVGSLSSGEISRSASFGTIHGQSTTPVVNTMFGGIAGYAKGSIARSYSSMLIRDAVSDAGGLVGMHEGSTANTITDSYASVSFLSSNFTKYGGLVGSASSLVLKRSFVTVWPKTRATAIVGSSTAAPSLEAAYFPISVQGSGELQGSSAMAANSATYDASFAGYKTSGFWQLGDKANWPILKDLPAELEPIAIQ